MPVNNQDRSKQPLRAGGNSAALPVEGHGAARGEQIAMAPADSVSAKSAGRRGFRGEQSSVRNDGIKEKHGQTKDMGKKSVGGKVVGAAPVIPAEVQVSERRHGAGNNPDGGHEHQMCHGGSEKVSAKTNRS